MTRRVVHALIVAGGGGLAAVLCFVAAQWLHPRLTLDMNVDLPRFASGFYSAERAGDLTFVWTAERASINLAFADRRVEWQCHVLLRGPRPAGMPPAVVQLEVDGLAGEPRMLGPAWETVDVRVPARSNRTGFRLTIRSATTFVPGPGDRRTLGVQIDDIGCEPSGAILPTPTAALRIAAGPAAFGAAAVLAGAGSGLGAAVALVLAAVGAWPLSWNAGPYVTGYQHSVLWIALWMAAAVTTIAVLVRRLSGRSWDGAELMVLLVPAATAYLKLIVLLHPSKALIDAEFHAHRLEWVLAGRYFFTQPIQSGVQFPYAIGLYAVTAPLTAFARDYVTLLRLVVVGTEAIGAGLLAWMAMRGWRDPRAGIATALLFAVVPLPYDVLGNANLTNAFAQSVALITVALATLWRFEPGQYGQRVAWALLASLGLLSHVSTFSILTVLLLGLAMLYWIAGLPDLRRVGITIGIGTLAALVIAVGLYYGRFTEAYRTLQAARAQAPSSLDAGARSDTDAAAPAQPSRIGRAVAITVDGVGWPLLLLSGIGVVPLIRSGVRNRVVLAIGAWGAAYLVFMGIGVVTAVDPRYVRYADEFLARTVFSTYPGIVLVASVGVSWGWRHGTLFRLVTLGLVGWAIVLGAREWMGWIA